MTRKRTAARQSAIEAPRHSAARAIIKGRHRPHAPGGTAKSESDHSRDQGHEAARAMDNASDKH
eukprot:15481918-Alexandrium_andersonii.AAC.1